MELVTSSFFLRFFYWLFAFLRVKGEERGEEMQQRTCSGCWGKGIAFVYGKPAPLTKPPACHYVWQLADVVRAELEHILFCSVASDRAVEYLTISASYTIQSTAKFSRTFWRFALLKFPATQRGKHLDTWSGCQHTIQLCQCCISICLWWFLHCLDDARTPGEGRMDDMRWLDAQS